MRLIARIKAARARRAAKRQAREDVGAAIRAGDYVALNKALDRLIELS